MIKVYILIKFCSSFVYFSLGSNFDIMQDIKIVQIEVITQFFIILYELIVM